MLSGFKGNVVVFRPKADRKQLRVQLSGGNVFIFNEREKCFVVQMHASRIKTTCSYVFQRKAVIPKTCVDIGNDRQPDNQAGIRNKTGVDVGCLLHPWHIVQGQVVLSMDGGVIQEKARHHQKSPLGSFLHHIVRGLIGAKDTDPHQAFCNAQKAGPLSLRKIPHKGCTDKMHSGFWKWGKFYF